LENKSSNIQTKILHIRMYMLKSDIRIMIVEYYLICKHVYKAIILVQKLLFLSVIE
jgi:uncharacterized protein (UPF0262 family)